MTRLRLPSRLRNAAQPWVVTQDQITCVKCFPFEIGTVTRNKKPVTDLAPQQLNRAKRWKIPAKTFVFGIDPFRKHEPDAVVLRRFGMISQHHEKSVAHIQSKSGEHSPYLGTQGSQRFHHKQVRKFRFRLGKTRHHD